MSHTLSCYAKWFTERGELSVSENNCLNSTAQFDTSWEAGWCHEPGLGVLSWEWQTGVWFLPLFWFCWVSWVNFLLLVLCSPETFPHIFPATSNPEVWQTQVLCKVHIISIPLAGKSSLSHLTLILGLTKYFKRMVRGITKWKLLLNFSDMPGARIPASLLPCYLAQQESMGFADWPAPVPELPPANSFSASPSLPVTWR